METGLLHLHSSLRYVIVFLFILSIIGSLTSWTGKKPFTKGSKMLYMFTMVFCHIQLVVGLLLYVMRGHYKGFSQMDVPQTRFFSVEHLSMMLLAIILVTIGYSSAKRLNDEVAKHKRTFIFYTLSFLVIFFAIPWPFLKDFGTWF